VSDPERLTRKIRAALAPCSLGQWPTPLEPVPPALARALGLEALWIKREDRSSPRYGGNKVRGLEFLLAGAPPGSVFVTVGGTGSTHCLATAVHAAALSCRAALAQFPQPETETSRAVAAACDARAALVVRAATRAGLPLAILAAWRGGARLGPRRWIPGGGAHPRAVVGHLLAALELGHQVSEPPEAIVAPLGSGGTVAGLLLGIAWLGWPTRVIAVRVAPRLVANRWRSVRLARRARRLLARVADGRGRVGAPARRPARPRPRSHVRRQGLRLFPATWNVERATRGLLAYVCHARASAGVRAMTAFPAVELTVYPYDCDAFGHLNQAALLTLLERARWEALARGPGMDLFDRNGVWPAARKAVIEYKAGAYPRDVLRIEMTVAHRGTTSVTLRHVVRRVADDALIAEAEIVFVCVDRLGRATPLPEEIARFLGPRTSSSHQPLRVPVGGAELGVEVRGDGPPLLLVHGFPFDRTMWRHQLAALARWKRIAPDLRGAGVSSAAAVGDGASVTRYADDLVAILDALGVGAAAVCGLSLGGYVTFELLRRHADRVSAVLLVDTKHEPDAAAAKRERDELAALTERDGPDALVSRLLPKLLAPETQPEVVEQVRAMARRWSVPGLVGALRALRDRPDSTETLRQIRVPTLVLAGSEDRIAPAAGARAMAALIPNAQFHVVPAAGHLAPLEQPLATTRVIADFLETLR